jgi:tRNA (adenine22-N1)-methyltransferase
MKQIKLSNRLGVIASFIGENAAVVDVGTDHGYLPVYLAQSGKARRIAATDIRRGPLARAMATAAEFGVSDRIEFVLTDGLDGIDGTQYDTVVIAGLGGETIAGILERAPWSKADHVRLVLQPQTRIGVLSNWLDNNGFAILDETLAEDDGKIYAVLLAGAGKSRAPLSCAEIYADRILLEKRDPLLPRYLDLLIEKTKRTVAGMERARRRVRIDELTHYRRALEGFMRMKEETDKWPR